MFARCETRVAPHQRHQPRFFSEQPRHCHVVADAADCGEGAGEGRYCVSNTPHNPFVLNPCTHSGTSSPWPRPSRGSASRRAPGGRRRTCPPAACARPPTSRSPPPCAARPRSHPRRCALARMQRVNALHAEAQHPTRAPSGHTYRPTPCCSPPAHCPSYRAPSGHMCAPRPERRSHAHVP